MVALDNAGVAVTLRDSGHVDLVAHFENVASRDRLSERELAFAAALELARLDAGRDVRLGEMPAHRTGDAVQLALAERHLDGFIAIGRRGLNLRHRAWPERQHGGSAYAASRVGHLGHPDFLSNQSGQHRPYSSLISTSTPAARSSLPSASIVCWVGSRTSSRRLCVRISKCSRGFLSTCGERLTVKRSIRVGSGIGPATRPPVRRMVSTISRTD